MGAMGSCFFLGWTISSLLVSGYSDLHGRKNTVLVSLIVWTLGTIGLILSKSLLLTCIVLVVMGFAASGALVVSWCYSMELLTPEW